MGNCMNNSSSAAVAHEGAKPEGVAASSCDERTIETSSSATISPPSSPVKTSAATRRVDPATAPQHDQASTDDSSMDRQREEGQRRLRELVVSGANAGDIDWKSIIALAEELHRKEQELLRSYSVGKNASDKPRRNISRRQAFFEKRRRRRELLRRRKLESVGSFSVNILNYDEDSERCRQQELPSNEEENDAHPPICNAVEDELDKEEEIDVFEDDDSSSLFEASSRCTPPLRPDTPSPFLRPKYVHVGITAAMEEGSFMAATSLFNPVEDDECSSSSSDSSNASKLVSSNNWDLMTINEESVSEW